MNAATKLALIFLALFVVGLLSMCWGCGRFSHGFAILGGMATCALGAIGFAAIVRAGR